MGDTALHLVAAPALEATGLQVARGGRPLFRGLGFRLARGGLLCVRGANGSGKTTLLRTLAGLSRPHRGRILRAGRCIRQAANDHRGTLQYRGHRDGLRGALTVLENLQWQAALYHHRPDREAVRTALAGMGMARHLDTLASQLSQGQRRRVVLASLALFPRCRLWLLDEPQAALDVEGAERFHALLARHCQEGGAVVACSHQHLRIGGIPCDELWLSDPAPAGARSAGDRVTGTEA
ncbi:cytochrome c biogenesis heme-transporting ATPase CcmA [Alkalilimnicola ehrlichii MLHE-1]|uniref:Cytochrome c biogenesis ATP-binding export protein CcmA n=1 Tax=Alkalilimnicola ehrlichii (strain ATCC BAA-1101 / DSM 17681 / MLHE-1) TaxID=187272 RepID=CCMA_ALKEH|nr:cytochrome c biogenesis heme-transporting ATPase CcmA [Alkalilimnicola ehrlichii]Q0A808.1 RecName: Full=Cytochrome c biogenesis ATP-binding export protein CcmA; AltName: Full=Heme exporter protein A [Alkalilimnicola ehrlichii MLHE-1]ABI57029.1 heme exporter protein CcmA [Alkalilimnicola ehrlichii MLHE-1]